MIFHKQFKSTTEAIGETLNEALEVLMKHNWCSEQEDTFCLRLCLEEALVNAVVHGNKNEAHKPIRLEVIENGDVCHIRISDEGSGFDPAHVHMADCETLGGRGVCLIKHYMDDLRFDTVGQYLEMTFRRGSFSCGCKESSDA